MIVRDLVGAIERGGGEIALDSRGQLVGRNIPHALHAILKLRQNRAFVLHWLRGLAMLEEKGAGGGEQWRLVVDRAGAEELAGPARLVTSPWTGKAITTDTYLDQYSVEGRRPS